MRRRDAPSFDVIEGGSGPADEEVFTLTDYLQLAQLGHKSVVVSIEAPGSRGEIVIREGEAWSAHDTHGDGEPAFYRLMVAGVLAGHAPAQVRALGPLSSARNLDQPLPALMMEAMRLFDESRRAPPRPVDDDVAEDHFTAFVEDGIDALLRKDYGEAYEAFSAAALLDPSDTLVQANLARLRSLGFGRHAEEEP